MRHDRLYDVQWRQVKQAAFAWIDSLQRLKHTAPVQVVTGTALNFLLVCERFKLNPRRVLETADKVLRRAREADPQYPRAIAQYLKEELRDG